MLTYDELLENERFLKILRRVWDERGEFEVDADNLDLAIDHPSAADLRIIKALQARDPVTQRGLKRLAVCFEQARREFLQQH